MKQPFGNSMCTVMVLWGRSCRWYLHETLVQNRNMPNGGGQPKKYETVLYDQFDKCRGATYLPCVRLYTSKCADKNLLRYELAGDRRTDRVTSRDQSMIDMGNI